MTHRESVVAGRVAGAEAGAAERRPDNGSGFREVRDITLPGEVEEHRLRRRIDRQRELPCAAALPPQEIGRLDDVGVGPARTAGDDALLYMQLSVPDLVQQRVVRPTARDLLRLFLHFGEDIAEI